MGIAPQPLTPNTVQFQHPFFSTNADGHFRLNGAERLPVYVISLGDQSGVVSFLSIKQQLALGDHGADEAMLDAVAEALKFVGELRLGDTLPDEIVSGEASWEPDARHLKIANRRIVAAMVKWSEQWEGPIAELSDLRRFLAEHVDREKIARALGRLDTIVGNGDGGVSQIQPVLMGLAKELSYIEALRENIERIRRIGAILEHVRTAGGGQANDTHKTAAVLRVFNNMMGMFNEMLASVDRQIDDISAAVAAHETVGGQMRQIRDQLRCELIAWEEQLTHWDGVTPKNIDLTVMAPKVGDLYRFLAPLYSPVDDWTRLKTYKDKFILDRRVEADDVAVLESPDVEKTPSLSDQ